MKKDRAVIWIAYVALWIFLYNAIVYLGYNEGNSSWIAYAVALFSTLSLVYVYVFLRIPSTRFSRFWTVWIIWQLVLFFLLFRGGRFVLIFYALLAPAGYMLMFTLSSRSQRNCDLGIRLGIVSFVFCLVFVIYTLINGTTYTLGETDAASVLTYWPLCLFPFVFLIRKGPWRTVLVVAMTIVGLITVKRGAVIILVFILISYLYVFRVRGGHIKTLGFVVFVVFLIAVVWAIYHYFGYYIDALSARMGNVVEDQGSGRFDIYRIVAQGIAQSNVIDLLIGHGCNSILELDVPNAHNDLLQMMYEYGLVGVVFYLVLLVNRARQLAVARHLDNCRCVAYLSAFYLLFFLGLFSNLVPLFSYFVFITMLWGLLDGWLVRDPNPKPKV